MTIPFKNIPASLRVPLFYAELDASHANTAQQAQRTLVIGQITGSATLTPNVPVLSQSTAEARAAGGFGSMLALMTTAYRLNDPLGELWYLPLADDGSAVAATGTITFTGTTTAAGTISLYIAGTLVSAVIAAGQTAAQIATTVAAAVNVAVDLPVTATAATAIVTLTARNKGLVGNDIDVRVNYLGSAGGEATPAGITITIVAMASGATNPSLTTGLAALGDIPFDFIISPFTDATSIAAITAFLGDANGRWSWQAQIYGHCFIAKRGTSGSLASFGAGLNDQHLSCIGFNDSPSPAHVWASAFAGAAAVSLRNDPGVPLQTLSVLGVLAPPIQSRFLLQQRNTLLYDGISTFTVSPVGQVAIENMITTYQTNGQGQPDNSYLEIETLFLLILVMRRLASVVTTKFARVKLGADGVRYAPTAGVVTPSTIRAELVSAYRQLESEGMVQNSDAFAAGLVVQQNTSNPNRVDVLYPAVLIDQLRVFAALIQFRLI